MYVVVECSHLNRIKAAYYYSYYLAHQHKAVVVV